MSEVRWQVFVDVVYSLVSLQPQPDFNTAITYVSRVKVRAVVCNVV